MSLDYEHTIMSAKNAKRWEDDGDLYVCTNYYDSIFKDVPENRRPKTDIPYTEEEVRTLLAGTEAEKDWNDHKEWFDTFADWAQEYGFYQYKPWRARKGGHFERISYIPENGEEIVIYFTIED